jgi:CBS domain-containing protein
MNTSDIMTSGLQDIAMTDSMLEAAKRMRDCDIGMLPVRNEDRRLVGIITDRDIAVRGVAQDRHPANTRVLDLMSQPVITCRQSDSIEKAASRMADAKVRRLVVVDDNQQAVGVLSLGDLAVKGAATQAEQAASAISQTSA